MEVASAPVEVPVEVTWWTSRSGFTGWLIGREGRGMTRDQAGLEAALRDAERRLQSAVRSGDADVLEQLLDDRVVYTGPDGRSLTKAEDLEGHRTRSLIVEAFDQEDLQVTVVGTTGITHVLATLQGVAAGRPFAARLRYTRTWVHAEGGWRVLAAHASAVIAPGS